MFAIPEFHRFISKKKLIPDSFNEELLKAVKTICYDEKNITFAGSFIFKSLFYSADVDVSEQFPARMSSQSIAKALQKVVKKILNSDYYILDIKSGYDLAFKGYFENTGYVKDQTLHFNYDIVKHDLDQCFRNGLIQSDDYDELVQLAKKSVSSIKYWLQMREDIRKLITLRWTPKEILQGYKYGISGEMIPLSVAVDLFVTKIDMIFIYQGFYTEMSNIFITKNSSNKGLVFYPISPDPNHYNDAIKYNLFEYLNSEQPNYLKALKRAFVLAKMENDQSMLQKISPLLVSDVGRLNKATNVLSTIQSMLENLSHPPIKAIDFQLNNLKPWLANIYQFPFNEKAVDSIIDKICRVNPRNKIVLIESLNDQLKRVINKQTMIYIEKADIKIPKRYLP